MGLYNTCTEAEPKQQGTNWSGMTRAALNRVRWRRGRLVVYAPAGAIGIRFKRNKVPEDLDVIVVGSGAGGLVTALLLARAGKKVLVLEQHDQAGGCCHTFEQKGYEFDTGIHYIGDLSNTPSRMLVDQLTEGQLDWAPMEEQFDEVAIGDPETARRYGLTSGREKYFDTLINFFPQEKAAIRQYEKMLIAANESYTGFFILKVLPKWLVTFLLKTGLLRVAFSFFKYTSVSLQEVLDSLTDNKELQTVLSYICANYGMSPEQTPFLQNALAICHFLNGAFYPMGGASEMALQLVRVVRRLGGTVLVQAPVSTILFDDTGRAVGVRVTKSSGPVDVHAKHVVSGAGVTNTFKTLLPAEVASKSCIYPLLDEVGPSVSFLTTFVGLDGSKAELNLPSANIWYYTSNDINKDVSDYMKLPLEDVASAPVPLCYISSPSAKDPAWDKRHPGKSTLLVITLSRWEWFRGWQDGRKGHRGEDYDNIKNTIGDHIWDVCCHLFPQLQGRRDYMEVGTPVTNKFYLGQPAGEICGLDLGGNRFTVDSITKLRADTDIPGLYLTGQDLLQCGFVPTLYTGILTASQILQRNVMSDFNKLCNQVKAKDAASKAI